VERQAEAIWLPRVDALLRQQGGFQGIWLSWNDDAARVLLPFLKEGAGAQLAFASPIEAKGGAVMRDCDTTGRRHMSKIAHLPETL